MEIPWELKKREFIVVLCCLGCVFLSTYNVVIISTNLSVIQAKYAADDASIMALSQMVAVSYVIFFIMATAIADKFGKRRTIIIGLWIIALTSLLCVFASNIHQLILLRMVNGFGVAFLQTTGNSILADVVSKKYLGDAMALCFSFSSLGAILASSAGYFVAKELDIIYLYISVIPICLLFIWYLRDVDNVIVKPDLKINYPVHLLYILSVLSIVIAMFNSESPRLFLVILAVILFVLMIAIHRRSENKVFLFKSLFASRSFTVAVILALLFNYVTCGMENSLNQFFQLENRELEIFGFAFTTATLAAFMISFKPVIQTVIAPMIAKHYRGKNADNTVILSFILQIASVIVLPVLFFLDDGLVIVVCTVIIYTLHAISSSFFSPHNKEVMMSSVSAEDRNMASSFTSVLSPLASIVGVMTLVNLIDGTDSLSSFRTSIISLLAILTTVAIIGTFIAAGRKKHLSTKSSE